VKGADDAVGAHGRAVARGEGGAGVVAGVFDRGGFAVAGRDEDVERRVLDAHELAVLDRGLLYSADEFHSVEDARAFAEREALGGELFDDGAHAGGVVELFEDALANVGVDDEVRGADVGEDARGAALREFE